MAITNHHHPLHHQYLQNTKSIIDDFAAYGAGHAYVAPAKAAAPVDKNILTATARVSELALNRSIGGDMRRYVRERIARDLGEELHRAGRFGVRVERDNLRCEEIHTLSIAVLPVDEYKMLKRAADKHEAATTEISRLKREIADLKRVSQLNAEKAGKYDVIKSALK